MLCRNQNKTESRLLFIDIYDDNRIRSFMKKILISSILQDPDLVEELRQKLDNLTAQVNAMGNGYTHF